jgi:hypothetical protein
MTKFYLAMTSISLALIGFGEYAYSAATNLNISKVEIGSSQKELTTEFPKDFVCKPFDNDKTRTGCDLDNCSIGDAKCKLWGNKDLTIIKSSAEFKSAKLTKLSVALDYSELQPKDARKILDGLIGALGTPSSCPLSETLKDTEKKKIDFNCIWSQAGSKVELEWDAGHPYVTLESAK